MNNTTRFALFISCVAVLASTAGIAAASGAFKLVMAGGASPEERAMCEAFLANLNSFPAWPPMVCKRPINPKFAKKFRRPEWRRWTDEEILSHTGLLNSR